METQEEYGRLVLDRIYNADCLEVMDALPEGCVDMTITSPPYDGIRTYEDTHDGLDYEAVLQGLYRITKQGGVLVWIVADQVINGDETGTSFRQALAAKDVGFKLLDTMIWRKSIRSIGSCNAYWNEFEYMFVFTKGKIRVVNLLKDRPNYKSGQKFTAPVRNRSGEFSSSRNPRLLGEMGRRGNIWHYATGNGCSAPSGSVAFEHPAIFPEALVADHVQSWSNIGDLVFDPFMGSGTTAVVARRLDRHYIGAELVEKYADICKRRLAQETDQMNLAHVAVQNGSAKPKETGT